MRRVSLINSSGTALPGSSLPAWQLLNNNGASLSSSMLMRRASLIRCSPIAHLNLFLARDTTRFVIWGILHHIQLEHSVDLGAHQLYLDRDGINTHALNVYSINRRLAQSSDPNKSTITANNEETRLDGSLPAECPPCRGSKAPRSSFSCCCCVGLTLLSFFVLSENVIRTAK